MKRKREDDNTSIVKEIMKRVKLCLYKKRKREDDDDDNDDVFALSSCKKRMKLEDSNNILRQNRRDILVYL